METHECRYQGKLVPDPWRVEGVIRERAWRRRFICAECGAERRSRRPRPPVKMEVYPDRAGVAPLSESNGRLIAKELAGRLSIHEDELVPARGLLSALARKGFRGTAVEQWLQAFFDAGWVGLIRRLSGTRRVLEAVHVVDRDSMEEYAAPGRKAEWARAHAEALAAVAGLKHPVAEEIARMLVSAKAKSFSVPMHRALASIALHVEKGDTLARRVFSSRYLGDSKAILALRPRLEKLLGPLEALGIREGAVVTLVGGDGSLTVGDQVLDLLVLRPFVGLSREAFEALGVVRFPRKGLLAVENLAPFEACCRGEVSGSQGFMVVFAAGYPGKAVRTLTERAGRAGVPVRAWADMDLDGVRIARMIASWSFGHFAPFRMDPRDIRDGVSGRPLSAPAEEAIREELQSRPNAILSDALQAILDKGRWVEQEEMLGR